MEKTLKVFKMNDCDWVAHYSEEEAKAYYHDFTGIDKVDVEEDFEGEVPLTNTMFWEKEEVDKFEANPKFVHEENSQFGDCYKVPFSWVIKNFPKLYPGCIATTEG